jgi:hypothetical protein
VQSSHRCWYPSKPKAHFRSLLQIFMQTITIINHKSTKVPIFSLRNPVLNTRTTKYTTHSSERKTSINASLALLRNVFPNSAFSSSSAVHRLQYWSCLLSDVGASTISILHPHRHTSQTSPLKGRWLRLGRIAATMEWWTCTPPCWHLKRHAGSVFRVCCTC